MCKNTLKIIGLLTSKQNKKRKSTFLKFYFHCFSLPSSLAIPYFLTNFQPQVPYKGVPYKKKRVNLAKLGKATLIGST